MDVTRTDMETRRAMGALRRAEAELIRARLGIGDVGRAEATVARRRAALGEAGMRHQAARLDNMRAGWGR